MLEFITEVIRSAEGAGLNNPWIILDNAPCHAGIERALNDANQVAPFPAYRIARLTPRIHVNSIQSNLYLMWSKLWQNNNCLNWKYIEKLMKHCLPTVFERCTK